MSQLHLLQNSYESQQHQHLGLLHLHSHLMTQSTLEHPLDIKMDSTDYTQDGSNSKKDSSSHEDIEVDNMADCRGSDSLEC